MNANIQIVLIYASSALAIVWAVFNALAVTSVKLQSREGNDDLGNSHTLTDVNIETLLKIGEKISKGANSILFQEYLIMLIFIVIFSIVVLLAVDIYGEKESAFRCYATVAFIIGSITSILCGFIGMRIAVESNYRTTFMAKKSLAEAFKIAYRAGCVMGFSSAGISLSILLSIILVYAKIMNIHSEHSAYNYKNMMELIAGYGLGGSCMALFGRVSVGIYTKTADVGADLFGKV
jgi:Na+/H+-translocating membrane pyrophosphatase